MDFKDIIGQYSKPEYDRNEKGSPKKIKKLEYAYKLISWLAERIDNKMYLINSQLAINNVESVPLNEIINLEF